MEWHGDLLLSAGRPMGSIRASGERWVAFVHSKSGAKLVGWFATRQDAQLSTERELRVRLPLEVVS